MAAPEIGHARMPGLLLREIREALPPTLFFAAGFVLIELTTQLILDEYLVRFANFMVAVGAALVVGKAVLVANMLPFLRRFDHAPLIRPILFKTVVYTLVVAVVRFLERLLEFFWGGGWVGSPNMRRRISPGTGCWRTRYGSSFYSCSTRP